MTRRIVFFAFDDCQSLDVLGPLEVFHGARTLLARRGAAVSAYELVVASFDTSPVRSESGARLCPDLALGELLEPFDTLVVAGGPGVAQLARAPHAVQQLRALSARARRTTSVCTGSFLLAATGLLAGRRATTHWEQCGLLQQTFPDVRVEADPIFVRDDPYWTSAGVTAGIDLALALVEADHGHQLASEVARQLVVFVRRAGGQRQLSAQLALQQSELPGVRELAAWAAEHPHHDLTVRALAKRVGMSERNFTRSFRAHTGSSPARFVEQLRVESACRLLELSGKSIEEVARAVGYAGDDALGRAFVRRLGMSPARYRASKR